VAARSLGAFAPHLTWVGPADHLEQPATATYRHQAEG